MHLCCGVQDMQVLLGVALAGQLHLVSSLRSSLLVCLLLLLLQQATLFCHAL